MPRHHSPDEGIVTARLDGAARRLLREQVDQADAIQQLHEITTDPVLLGRAAGTALGGWFAHQTYASDQVAELLTAAGADHDVRDHRATEVRERLGVDRGRAGIGNP